jgi:hypothetical protein
LGTAPPVHGLTVQSGAGSGQYEARSTWASAGALVSASRAVQSNAFRSIAVHDGTVALVVRRF